MSATLNVGSFRSDDTLYAASRTLKSYLRSILMRKWDPTDPKVRFGSTADGRPPLGYVRFTPQSGHGVGCLEMSALCRLCCKSIFGIWSRNIDSRSDTNEQQRFKRTDAPIRLLQISISQSLLGDFCNTICHKPTYAPQQIFPIRSPRRRVRTACREY